MIRHAGILRRYEVVGIVATDPPPSELIRRMEVKKQEILRNFQPDAKTIRPKNTNQATQSKKDRENPAVSEKPIGSHRQGAVPRRRRIDWSKVAHIALPAAPPKWEVPPRDYREDALAEPFAIVDSQYWKALNVCRIAPSERPDPAYRKLYAIGNGLLALDDLGKSNNSAKPAVMRYGRTGQAELDQTLAHGVYRLGVSSMSGAFIGLSKGHVAHAYDDHLRLILETDLSKSAEILQQQDRFGITPDELHRYIRSIALSDDARRYLFTAVDEAYCVELDGTGIWSLSVPLKDGYRLQSETSVGTQVDIQQVLEVLDLRLPLAAGEVKQRYRALAKKWHPDINPSPEASSRMREINHAFSLLTGLRDEELARYCVTTRTAYKEMTATTVSVDGTKVTISSGMVLSEIFAADWIYASAFAANSSRAFVATYSGRVVEVDESGRPLRYYSIGNVPRRIVDTGDYLYFLTDTRLYVLKDETLVSLVDSWEADVVVAQTGFGLLEKKRFRWYDQSGVPIATVLSKDPLRRVYQRPGEVIVETRSHRLSISGARSWWE